MQTARRVGAFSLALAALLAGGCSSSDPKTTTTSTAGKSTTSAPVPVTVGALTVVSNPDSVLSFELKFTTSAPAVMTLHVDGPGGAWSATPERAPAKAHTVPVVGLRAESKYEAWVEAADGAGESKRVTLTTGALPADFPTLKATKSVPAEMAPGVTMFTVTTLPPANPPANAKPLLGNLIAVDAAGEVVWYHRAPVSIGDAKMLPNGHILYEYNNMGAQEIDILGRVVREWAGRLERGEFRVDRFGRTVPGPKAIPLDLDTVHHELTMLPNGNILTLANELRTLSGFTRPMCNEPPNTFTGSYQLIIDVIVEFEPATGKIVREYPLTDYFHPQTDPADENICGYPGASQYPNYLYASHGDVYDWTHANAVILDEKNNRLIISVRHLNTVLAITYEADSRGPGGTELWRFGPKGSDFELAAGGKWQLHQHAVELQPDGSILLYDNGNDRPDTDPLYSRAVRYAVDDTGPKSSWTVSQEWEYRPTIDGTPAYAFFVSDADRLENGNVLIDTGGLIPPVQGVNSQIDEVVPAGSSGGKLVFQLRLIADTSFVYRATRVPSLYGAD